MEVARTMGSQQTSLEHLELQLEAEQEGIKKGQRYSKQALWVIFRAFELKSSQW